MKTRRQGLSLDLKLIVGIVVLGAVGGAVGLSGWKGLVDQRRSAERVAVIGEEYQELLRRQAGHQAWARLASAGAVPPNPDAGPSAVPTSGGDLAEWLLSPGRARLEAAVPETRAVFTRLDQSFAALRGVLEADPTQPARLPDTESSGRSRAPVEDALSALDQDFAALDPLLKEAHRQALSAGLREGRFALWSTWLGMGVGALVDGWVALMILRLVSRPILRITSQLTDGSQRVAEASAKMAETSQALAERTRQQATGLDQTDAAMKRLGNITQRNSKTAQRATELSRLATEAAEAGAGEMRALTGAMAGIKEAGDQVSQIIQSIDAIAFQTNLLALNAAVEAARAGQSGLGFAVVADEVRALAQRSAQAAKQTEEQIAAAIGRTQQGVAISSRVSEQLDQIVARIRELGAAIHDVAAASGEQSQGFSQVTTSTDAIAAATQANAATAVESVAAARDLHEETRHLETVIGTLSAMVQGSDFRGFREGHRTRSTSTPPVPSRLRNPALHPSGGALASP